MFWFVFCKDDLVVTAAGNIPCGGDCPIRLEPWNTIHRLPMLGGEECRCVSVDTPVQQGDYRQVSLRSSFDILTAEEYAMASKAREIIYWDQTTQYCGICGSPMKKDSDISKKCTCCGKQIWPALATAIIVMIRRQYILDDGSTDDEILMVKAHNFRGNHYGLVAGFVETAESLEECLHREVLEEVGIKVSNVKYFGSQPWPYPSGLMVGFTADYESGELNIQREELADAKWVRRDALPPLPGKVSLARRLVDSWLERR